MTVIPKKHRRTPAEADYSDVIIIGAGISGLGAAYRITERNPNMTYTVLERRERIGGTWDLFRYPACASDSSIFTLSFPFEPWTRKEGVADGVHIREYLSTTAHKYGIDGTSSSTAMCAQRTGFVHRHLDVTVNRRTQSSTAAGSYSSQRLLQLRQGYAPDFPGIEQFGGTVVHPQHWPKTSTTAARTCGDRQWSHRCHAAPTMSERAAKVTMLQRSPTT